MTPVLWELLKPYRWRMALAMGLRAVAGLASLLPWVLVSWWADTLVTGGAGAEGAPMGAIPGLVAATMVVWLVSQALAVHLAHGVDADLCGDLRRRLLTHLERAPLDWFSRQGQDGVARLADQDVRALHQLVAHAPTDLSSLVVVPFAALLCLAWLQPALLVFCLVPLAAAAAGFALLRSPAYRDEGTRRDAALERLSVDYGEFAQNLPLARQYPGAGVQRGVELSAKGFESAFSAWVKRVGHVAALIELVLGGPWLMAWVLLGAMALAVLGMPLAVGPLCAFLLLTRAMAAPIQAMGHGADALMGARAAAERLQAVCDLPPLSEGRAGQIPRDGSVVVRGLRFSYPDREVLKGVDLDLAEGGLNALVGPSGSGKSTMLHVLARHMDPQAGTILVGGVPLRDLPDAVRHRHIVMLTQQAVALDLSLRENIALLCPEAKFEDIRQAARDARLDDAIMALPRGYDSLSGRDVKLSGGEVQRLALARALLSSARLFLLCEPASATDPQTAQALHRAVRERLAGRTRLIVCHRLSEVSDADRIVVCHEGRFVAQGTHAHLLSSGGLYADLWRDQRRAEGEAA
ncbi:MAG TPA: multidrug ABC transporter permease [Rhodospirillum rubrum]|nr:multidrug ABC transporter permease [Rhodospirillum rubrum]